MSLFDDRVAIITGAARGLGFDYATYFLRDNATTQLTTSPNSSSRA